MKVRVEKFFENRKLGGSVDGEGWSDADHQDETYHFSTHFLARAFGFEDNDDVSGRLFFRFLVDIELFD